MPAPFNPTQWLARCEELANQAGRNCGQSDIVYVNLISRDIGSELVQFSGKDRIEAEYIARQFDYMSPAELQVSDIELAVSGLCKHGLDPDCCPAGCGDIDY
jgi:hypothetical protein